MVGLHLQDKRKLTELLLLLLRDLVQKQVAAVVLGLIILALLALRAVIQLVLALSLEAVAAAVEIP